MDTSQDFGVNVSANVREVLWACAAGVDIPGTAKRPLRNGDVIIEPAVVVVHPALDDPAPEIYAGVIDNPPSEGELVAFRLRANWPPEPPWRPHALRDSVRAVTEGEWNQLRQDAALAAIEKTLALSSRAAALKEAWQEHKAARDELKRQAVAAEDRRRAQAAEVEQWRAEAAAWLERETAELAADREKFEASGGPRFLRALSASQEDQDRDAIPIESLPPPSDLLEQLIAQLEQAGLSIPGNVVRRSLLSFLLSSALGQLWLLAGPPGTGKTTIAAAMSSMLGAHSDVIPVRPGWLDSTDVLGYFDSRDNRFVAGPLLDSLMDAVTRMERGEIRVVVLDEMNIGRIENYGADLLSQLEKARDEQADAGVQLYAQSILSEAERDLALAASQENDEVLEEAARRVRRLQAVPPHLRVPDNLVVAGTLNNDDTTYRLSPKVLDRSVAVRVPFTKPTLRKKSTISLASPWTISRGWTQRFLAEASTEQAAAEDLWSIASDVILPSDQGVLHLSHRSAACVSLLPSLGAQLGINPQELLDDLLVIKALPWVRFLRGETRAMDDLVALRDRARGAGLKGLADETDRLIVGQDEVVQYLR